MGDTREDLGRRDRNKEVWVDSGDSGLLIPMLEDARTFMRLFKVGTLVLAFPQPCVK